MNGASAVRERRASAASLPPSALSAAHGTGVHTLTSQQRHERKDGFSPELSCVVSMDRGAWGRFAPWPRHRCVDTCIIRTCLREMKTLTRKGQDFVPDRHVCIHTNKTHTQNSLAHVNTRTHTSLEHELYSEILQQTDPLNIFTPRSSLCPR